MTRDRWFFALCLALLTLALGGPIVVAVAAIRLPDAVAIAGTDPIRHALAVSLGASSLAIGFGTLLGVPGGYLLARTSGWWRAPVIFLLALPLACPPVAAGVLLLGSIGERTPLGGFLAAHGLPLVDRFAGVTLAEFFVSAPFIAIASAAAFSDLDRAYEEAARTLGSSAWRAFATVALPLALPGVAAGMLLAWLRALGEYGATTVVAYHPASLPIALSIVLSADGLRPALALTVTFLAVAAVAIGVQWLLRRRLI